MRMRYLTLLPALLFCIILPASAADGGMLIGEVTYKSYQQKTPTPLAGVTVVIADFSLTQVYRFASTNVNGIFTVTDVPPGTYCIVVDHPEYTNAATTATITSDEIMVCQMLAHDSWACILRRSEHWTEVVSIAKCPIYTTVPNELPGKEWAHEYAGSLPGVFVSGTP